ncbi:MAG: ribulose-phosphate 3-epimerase [Cyanobacteria bacterium RUI128]|nr:ribulose-phosphate 3-epimerase [Cyanobacteria bacterium RUI128]
MSKSVIISPSILSADFANLERDIRKVEDAGAEWLHIDVMDGHFVPNITIGVPVVKSIKKITGLTLDVHLMIEHPEKYIKSFVDAGADIVTVHYEAEGVKENPEKILKEIKALGVLAGLSIKPKTPKEVIEKFIGIADLILVMTVEPGFGGQQFIPECAEKLQYISSRQTDGQFLQVDGGINSETAKICVNNGVNSLVAGNYIFSSDNYAERINSLR